MAANTSLHFCWLHIKIMEARSYARFAVAVKTVSPSFSQWLKRRVGSPMTGGTGERSPMRICFHRRTGQLWPHWRSSCFSNKPQAFKNAPAPCPQRNNAPSRCLMPIRMPAHKEGLILLHMATGTHRPAWFFDPRDCLSHAFSFVFFFTWLMTTGAVHAVLSMRILVPLACQSLIGNHQISRTRIQAHQPLP